LRDVDLRAGEADLLRLRLLLRLLAICHHLGTTVLVKGLSTLGMQGVNTLAS
jgi:hypothetical protein